jgi:maltodextrin utilization protein YvdJ
VLLIPQLIIEVVNVLWFTQMFRVLVQLFSYLVIGGLLLLLIVIVALFRFI